MLRSSQVVRDLKCGTCGHRADLHGLYDGRGNDSCGVGYTEKPGHQCGCQQFEAEAMEAI